MTTYTISAFTENSPGVLHRITVIFTRRKTNIESLTVSETVTKGISRFTIVLDTEENTIQKIVNQIRRIVEVKEAYASQNNDLIYREIALFRMKTDCPEARRQIEEVSQRYGAHMAFTDSESMVIEKTGTEEDVRSLYLLLEPFKISEFVRSGRISLLKVAGTPVSTQAPRADEPRTPQEAL